MAKRIWGVLAAIGLAFAAALVKGIVSKGLDALGWVGWGICFGFVVLVAVATIASRSSKAEPDPTVPPTDPPPAD